MKPVLVLVRNSVEPYSITTYGSCLEDPCSISSKFFTSTTESHDKTDTRESLTDYAMTIHHEILAQITDPKSYCFQGYGCSTDCLFHSYFKFTNRFFPIPFEKIRFYLREVSGRSNNTYHLSPGDHQSPPLHSLLPYNTKEVGETHRSPKWKTKINISSQGSSTSIVSLDSRRRKRNLLQVFHSNQTAK